MHLTNKESEVIRVLATGKTDVEIAQLMGISINTLKTHLKSIYRKLNARNRVEAVMQHAAKAVVH